VNWPPHPCACMGWRRAGGGALCLFNPWRHCTGISHHHIITRGCVLVFKRTALGDNFFSARSMPIRTLLIDNYDSYTYNLFQLIAEVNGGEAIPAARIRTSPAFMRNVGAPTHHVHALQSYPRCCATMTSICPPCCGELRPRSLTTS
jgi:hypothetical protein